MVLPPGGSPLIPWNSPEEYSRHILGAGGLTDWCRLECRIQPDTGLLAPLIPNTPQGIFLNILEMAERFGAEIVRILILKARQYGQSTVSAAVCCREMIRRPGTMGLVVTDETSTTEHVLTDMYRVILDHLGVMGAYFKIVEPNRVFKIGLNNGSQVIGATAGNVRGQHGKTFSWVHADETAQWRDPERSIKGLGPAARNAKLFLEMSTANGRGGYFYERWLTGQDFETWKELPPDKRTHIRLFMPWTSVDAYRLEVPALLEQRVLNLIRTEPLSAQSEGLIDAEEIDLILRGGLSLGQVLWRRQTIQEVCHGSMEMFHEQFPQTPEEAFVAGGNSVFSAPQVSRLESLTRDPITREDGGETWIWEPYRRDRRYSIGIDSAAGIPGRDLSCVQLGLIPENPTEYVTQVVEHLGSTKPKILALIAVNLAKRYGDAWIWCERNGLGLATLDAIRALGYPYVWGDGKQVGIHQTDVTREALWTWGRDVLQETDGVRSRRLVAQAAGLIYTGERIDHPKGAHDDAWAAYVMMLDGARKAGSRRTTKQRTDRLQGVETGLR